VCVVCCYKDVDDDGDGDTDNHMTPNFQFTKHKTSLEHLSQHRNSIMSLLLLVMVMKLMM